MIHELDLNQFHMSTTPELRRLSIVNSGYYRHVWMFREYDGTKRALKTLKYEKKKLVDRAESHRIEAVALEQLTASPFVANIYSYCMNSAVFDFADEGDLASNFLHVDELPDEEERLRIAYDVARAVADAHNVDRRGRATIAHTDIKPKNFVLNNGHYQLNDFNRAELLSWSRESDEACGFSFEYNQGRWRSPEEYRGGEDLTEKIDVWSLGLVLFVTLTGQDPWEDKKEKDVIRMVTLGGRPDMDLEILESDRMFHKTMLRAMDMCFIVDPKERASASEVADFLEAAMRSTKTLEADVQKT